MRGKWLLMYLCLVKRFIIQGQQILAKSFAAYVLAKGVTPPPEFCNTIHKYNGMSYPFCLSLLRRCLPLLLLYGLLAASAPVLSQTNPTGRLRTAKLREQHCRTAVTYTLTADCDADRRARRNS